MAPSQTSTLPLDAESSAALARTGLEYALVDPDGDGFPPFLTSVARGFLGEEPTPEQIESSRSALRIRRLTGVFDRAGAQPDAPVATVDSWISELTVSPERTLPIW